MGQHPQTHAGTGIGVHAGQLKLSGADPQGRDPVIAMLKDIRLDHGTRLADTKQGHGGGIGHDIEQRTLRLNLSVLDQHQRIG